MLCPYCQTAIHPTAPKVICPECHIPHHAECWEENGRCTTFGCEGQLTTHRPASSVPDSVIEVLVDHPPFWARITGWAIWTVVVILVLVLIISNSNRTTPPPYDPEAARLAENRAQIFNHLFITGPKPYDYSSRVFDLFGTPLHDTVRMGSASEPSGMQEVRVLDYGDLEIVIWMDMVNSIKIHQSVALSHPLILGLDIGSTTDELLDTLGQPDRSAIYAWTYQESPGDNEDQIIFYLSDNTVTEIHWISSFRTGAN